jgi:hypothetical protein
MMLVHDQWTNVTELAVQEHILWTMEYGQRLSHRSIKADMDQLKRLQVGTSTVRLD